MKNITEQKTKLAQKKNRVAKEETKLKLKERKMRIRHLIEVGGLVAKAKLDFLPTNTLYGALLSLSLILDKDSNIRETWTRLGVDKFNEEEQQPTTKIVLQFETQPPSDIRKLIRNHGLGWNKFRSEWYGSVSDVAALKEALIDHAHNIEILNNN